MKSAYVWRVSIVSCLAQARAQRGPSSSHFGVGPGAPLCCAQDCAIAQGVLHRLVSNPTSMPFTCTVERPTTPSTTSSPTPRSSSSTLTLRKQLCRCTTRDGSRTSRAFSSTVRAFGGEGVGRVCRACGGGPAAGIVSDCLGAPRWPPIAPGPLMVPLVSPPCGNKPARRFIVQGPRHTRPLVRVIHQLAPFCRGRLPNLWRAHLAPRARGQHGVDQQAAVAEPIPWPRHRIVASRPS